MSTKETQPIDGSTVGRPNPGPGPTYRAVPGGGGQTLLAQRAQARALTELRRRRLRVTAFILVGLIAAGGLTAWALLSQPIDQAIKSINHIFVTPVAVRPAPEGGPNATPVPVVYPDWDKKEPVNILLMGLDFRPQEKDSRADTMVVVHVDPANKTASMLSIPRDLWLEIPGHGEDRINAAFQIGEDEAATTPGGGPGLAMSTVEHNFGIKIHYFAEVDFTGFERIVDTIGGVDVDVAKPLADNEYPLPNYGTTRIYIPGGLQHMDGQTALRYARSRHADSDLGRNSRQQQVLLAIRQQGLNLNLITRLNDILTQLSGAVKTDLSLSQVGSLAQLARQIDRNEINTVLIDDNMVEQTILPSGANVLLPRWTLIRPKVQQAFANPSVAGEAARLSVQNGTTTNGVARTISEALTEKGYIIADLSAATDQGNYPATTITDFSGGKKPLTLDALSKELNIPLSRVKTGDPGKAPVANTDGQPVDIVIVAGDDRIK